MKKQSVALTVGFLLVLIGARGGRCDPALGVYCGNTPADVTQFESWLGCPVQGILGEIGPASWSDFDGSVPWAVSLWGALDRPVFWSVPLIPKGATLQDAAAGAYNDHYVKAAQKLAAFRPQDQAVHIRTGEEFNGDWFPWAAQADPQAFVGAYRQFVTSFRSVSNRFVFEWNVNLSNQGMDPATAYPGDAYVDIIGMDFYWDLRWSSADPATAWNSMVTSLYGLNWHQAFAQAHGKPTAYSEWGIESDDAAVYIQQAAAWFSGHPVAYQTYWNSNAAFPGKLSGGQYPSSAAAYIAAFGKCTPPARPADPATGLRDVYVFPNPAVGQDPVIRAKLGLVDRVEITIFDASGQVVHSAALDGAAATVVNGEYCYDYVWKGKKASGAYYAVVHGKKGNDIIRGRVKFIVVK